MLLHFCQLVFDDRRRFSFEAISTAYVEVMRNVGFSFLSGLPDMAYFQTKNPNLSKFCRVLQWKMLVYFMAIWSILRQFKIYFVAIWYGSW
jgi:hypothetical protein